MPVIDAVCLFLSVVVSTAPDWGSCTSVDGCGSPGASGAGTGAKHALKDSGLGPPLITLLHELIEQLRMGQRTRVGGSLSQERQTRIALVIREAFLLLVECIRDHNVEMALFGCMFRQLYVGALVALSSGVPLHASLLSLQPHAAELLHALSVFCATAPK